MSSTKQVSIWCGTEYLNASVENFPAFIDGYKSNPDVIAFVGQLEACPETGRLHYQFAVRMRTKQRISGMKKVSATAHWIAADGDWASQVAYCTKATSRVECPESPAQWGDAPAPGKRNDLHAVSEHVKAFYATGSTDVEELHRQVADKFPEVVLKYAGNVRSLLRLLQPKAAPRIARDALHAHQLELLYAVTDAIDSAKDPRYTRPDRQIIWVKDFYGGSGKSVLVQHLVAAEGAVVLSGKIMDMAHAFNGQKIVIFDLSRTQAELIDHLCSFAEMLKNGVIFSAKYDSGMKIFAPPHVIFFSNSDYPEGKWSEDRKSLWDWDDHGLGKGRKVPPQHALPFTAATRPALAVLGQAAAASSSALKRPRGAAAAADEADDEVYPGGLEL